MDESRRNFLKNIKLAASWSLASGMLSMLGGCMTLEREKNLDLQAPNNRLSAKVRIPPPEVDGRRIRQVRLMAVGDIMAHMRNIELAFDDAAGGYDFFPYFEMVAPILNQADWVIGNLETRLAGEEAGYSGYPLFNAPDQLAFALKRAGFSLLGTANNHCLDKGASGVVRTNETLTKAGLLYTGSFSDPEDERNIRMLRKNGLNLAVTAYTYGSNGIPIPRGREFMVNLINPEKIKDDFKRCRAAGADFIICLMHYGFEYHRYPCSSQKKLTNLLFKMGADLVLGSHPHVVQPCRFFSVDNQGRLAAYSLGNFISNQRRKFTDLGVILEVTLMKDSMNMKRTTGIRAIPIKVLRLTLKGRPTYRIYPMSFAGDLSDYQPSSKKELEKVLDQFVSLKKHIRSQMS